MPHESQQDTLRLLYCCRYKLQHMVRTHMGSDDEAYNCISQQEDSEGTRGIKLDKVHPLSNTIGYLCCAIDAATVRVFADGE